MPNCQLAITKHFEIVWWPGADSRGLYVSQTPETFELDGVGHFSGYVTKPYARLDERSVPQFFVDRALVSSLIDELRGGNETMTILSRVTFPFVPGFHRRPKKDGGVPGQAYYTPLVVEGEQRQELADALEFACSKKNVTHLEANNSAEGYSVLDNDYLEDGVWHSTLWLAEQFSERVSKTPTALELPPAKLEQTPKIRFRAPSHSIYGHGATLLRTSRTKQQCNQRPCIDYFWIKPNEQYVEHRQGSHTARYHIKCAFRNGKIPSNWLNPHFEQYYALVKLGLKGWIQQEREKREDYDEEEFKVPSNAQRVTEFVQKMKDGYQLDEYERQEWRDHLRHVPVDVEPYQTARELVGLPDPRK